LAKYSTVWRAKGVASLVSSQLLARFPFGLMSVAFVIHIHATQGSYAIAGLALGAESIANGVSGPILARALGRFGVRRTLLVSMAISSAGMIALGLWVAPPAVVIVLSALIGFSAPPIQTTTRTVYPTLVSGSGLTTLFALDANLQEIIWVLGPLVATSLAAGVGTWSGIIFMAICLSSGTIWFTSNHGVKNLQLPRPNKSVLAVLKKPMVLANAVTGFFLIGSFSGVEVGAVAILPKVTAGLVIGALSLGSMVGGFGFGHRLKSARFLPLTLTLSTAGYALTYFAPTNPEWMAIAWFITGLGIAPALGLLGALIGHQLDAGDSSEAYGWIGTAQVTGYSIAAAISGILVDTVSPVAPIALSVVFAAGAVLLSFWVVRHSPAKAHA
jgi:MFS family permease